ncbi:MCE family protein [Mycolicibacterium neoaurum]|uniref:MlaD family protein n=1 Tax=Mycolicibacterium neoaurum TaxID=1795 RepID=UPI001BCB9924|nr:MlaD family protein [Mycolicibacterium neoaurum]QVI27219.1 MCE family protein [Mycolicibacterium neoaurum]
MRIRDVISFVAMAAILAGTVGYFGLLGIRVGPPADRTRLSLQLEDANNLVAGSRVLLRGVQIGQVTAVSTTVESAVVDFYFDGKYRIPADSKVKVENLSALGETYIGLVPLRDDGPMFEDGTRLAADQVRVPASISELATSVVRVLNQLDSEALRRIVIEAEKALPDPSVALPSLATASSLLRDRASNMNGAGRELLSNFQTLLRNADWVGPVLADVAAPARDIGFHLQDMMNVLGASVERGAPQTFYDFHRFFDRLQGFLDTRGGDLKVLFGSMEPQLSGITGSLMNFDTGQLLGNLLASIPEEGSITLRVAPPA